MECPRCDGALLTYAWEDAEVDACPKCNGVWLSCAEWEAISDNLAPTSETRSQLRCPECETKMLAQFYGSTEIDRCKRGHGLWFDRDEIDTICSELNIQATLTTTLRAIFPNSHQHQAPQSGQTTDRSHT